MLKLLCLTGGLLVCLLLVGLVPDSAQADAFQRENMATQSGNEIAASSHANTTVFVIMMENHRWAHIFRNPDAPYINRTLLPIASYARQYYNPPYNHPSEPNYLWLEARTNFGIYDDNGPYVNHQSTTKHLVTLLQRAGISWKSYQVGVTPLLGDAAHTVDLRDLFVAFP